MAGTNHHDLVELAHALLEVDATDERTAEAAYAASLVAAADFGQGWRLLMTAFNMATSALQLQYVGAAVLEVLFRHFPMDASAAAVALLQEQPRFVPVLAAVSLSGVPAAAWMPVNEALKAAGVPEGRLIDWSVFEVPRDEV